MTNKIAAVSLALFALFLCSPQPAMAQSAYSIVALVNDEPISNHDINMRLKLALADSPDVKKRLQKKAKEKRTQRLWKEMVEKHRPTSRAEASKLQAKLIRRLRSEVQSSLKRSMRKKILKELVDERLQMQQATKLGVALTEADIDDRLGKMASRNKHKKSGKPMTRKDFDKLLKRMGIPLGEFRKRMKAKGSWVRVVRRKFSFQVNIGDQDIDRMLNVQGDKNAKLQTVYKLQRVRLRLSSTASESRKAAYLVNAEKLRQTVTSCEQLKKVIGSVSNASIKSVGSKSETSFPHAIQAFLKSTQKGRLTPPTVTSSGIELYAVCDRKQRKVADLSKREKVKEKLRQQEFQILAKRYMQDLRQEASIDYR